MKENTVSIGDLKIGDFFISDIGKFLLFNGMGMFIDIKMKIADEEIFAFTMLPTSIRKKFYSYDKWATHKHWHRVIELSLEPYYSILLTCSKEDINRIFRDECNTKAIINLFNLL